jgi:hypothetical protein
MSTVLKEIMAIIIDFTYNRDMEEYRQVINELMRSYTPSEEFTTLPFEKRKMFVQSFCRIGLNIRKLLASKDELRMKGIPENQKYNHVDYLAEDISTLEALLMYYVPTDDFAGQSFEDRKRIVTCMLELKAFLVKLLAVQDEFRYKEAEAQLKSQKKTA